MDRELCRSLEPNRSEKVHPTRTMCAEPTHAPLSALATHSQCGMFTQGHLALPPVRKNPCNYKPKTEIGFLSESAATVRRFGFPPPSRRALLWELRSWVLRFSWVLRGTDRGRRAWWAKRMPNLIPNGRSMVFRTRVNSHRLVWLFSSFSWFAALACTSERKESDACLTARETARALSVRGDIEGARQQLERARTECSPASSYDLERLERTFEREERHRAQRAELAQPATSTTTLAHFMTWVRTQRESTQRERGEHECAPRESPAYGSCTSRIPRPEGAAFEVRYWTTAPDKAARFSWQTHESIRCEDFGAHRKLGSWTRDGAEFELCELLDQGVLGFKVLVTRSSEPTRIDVFTNQYLARDTEFAKRAKRP